MKRILPFLMSSMITVSIFIIGGCSTSDKAKPIRSDKGTGLLNQA